MTNSIGSVEETPSPQVDEKTPSPQLAKTNPCPACGGKYWSKPKDVKGFSLKGGLYGLLAGTICGPLILLVINEIPGLSLIAELIARFFSAQLKWYFKIGIGVLWGFLVVLCVFIGATQLSERTCLNCGKVVRKGWWE